MNREEAIAIIRKEYLCVDRDCDIERSCGRCDLMMPSKEPILEAYEMAIKALEQQTCEDAVSRQAVLGLFAQNADAIRPYSKTWEEVKALPSVNPQPKTGHWIKYGKLYQCSECKELSCCQGKFCNECGAKMVEPQESEE